MPARPSSIIAYHLVWTAYGTWLPNDPRGSGSHRVVNPAIQELGEIHYGRKKVQPPRAAVREFYEHAEGKLQFPIVPFDARQIATSATAFAECLREERYTCYACAILPDHVHLVVRKHRARAEEMIRHLQRSRDSRSIAPTAFPVEHPVWTDGGWRTFLNSPDHVRTAIHYVERNPAKSGLAAQRWPFVVPYDGWPHPSAPLNRRVVRTLAV